MGRYFCCAGRVSAQWLLSGPESASAGLSGHRGLSVGSGGQDSSWPGTQHLGWPGTGEGGPGAPSRVHTQPPSLHPQPWPLPTCPSGRLDSLAPLPGKRDWPASVFSFGPQPKCEGGPWAWVGRPGGGWGPPFPWLADRTPPASRGLPCTGSRRRGLAEGSATQEQMTAAGSLSPSRE